MAKIETVAKAMLFTVVAAMLLMVVVMPVIQSTTVEYTYSDNEEPTYKMAQKDMTFKLKIDLISVVDNVATYKFTDANDEESTVVVDGTDNPRQVFIWDNGLLILNRGDMQSTLMNVSNITWLQGAGDSITFNGAGQITATKGESTRTSSYTWVIAPDEEGDLGYFADYGCNVSTGTGTLYAVTHNNGRNAVGFGTLSSMQTLIGSASYTWTVNTEVPEGEEPSEYYKTVSGVTVVSGNSESARGCIADIAYTDGIVSSTGMTQTLLNILPIVLLVVLVMAVVGIVTSRND